MKRLVEISPLIVAFLIFNGFLKLYIFYGHWDIRIIDYLDFSEIILSFLNDLNIIVLCLVVFVFHQLTGITLIKMADQKLKGKLEVPINSGVVGEINQNQTAAMTVSNEPISDILDYIFTRHKDAMLILCFVVTSIFAGLFFYTNNLFWLYTAIASLGQFLLLFIDNSILANEKVSYEIAIILTFLTFTCCLARRDIREIEKNTSNNITTVFTDNGTIMTTPTNFLLGKTQNFIYIYDNQTNCTQIISVDEINSIRTQNIK